MIPFTENFQALDKEHRQYVLQYLPQHLFSGGKNERLFQLMLNRGWFETHQNFDPSYQSYSTGLDLALQNCESETDDLSALLVLSLLRATINTLTSKLPLGTFGVMVDTGLGDRAKFYAEQRTDRSEKTIALELVGLAYYRAANGKAALEAIQLAEQTALTIEQPASQIKMLCRVAIDLSVIGSNAKRARELLNLAAELNAKITNLRTQTHAHGNIAKAARAIGDHSLWHSAMQSIKTAYEKMSEKPPDSHGVTLSSRLEGSNQQTWKVAEFARDLHLMDKPEYLLSLVLWDQARNPLSFNEEGGMQSAVLHAAADLHDLETCEDVVNNILAKPPIAQSFSISAELIEALAELGFVDKAITLISIYLVDTEDAETLKMALARGAGKRGDLKTIERAVAPITPSGLPQAWIDRFWRKVDGLIYWLKQIACRALRLPLDERLNVLWAGYESLKKYHPQLVDTLLERIKGEGGRFWQQLVRERLGTIQEKKKKDLRYLKYLLPIVQHLPNGDDVVEDVLMNAVRRLAFVGNFDRALEITAKVDLEFQRSLLLKEIAEGLLEHGETEKALDITQKITDNMVRQQVLAETIGQLGIVTRKPEKDLVVTTAMQVGLEEKEKIAFSEAFPVLLEAYLRCRTVSQALAKIKTMNNAAISAALPALSAAAMAQADRTQAQYLISLAKEQASPKASIVALAEMATHWASDPTWSKTARQAYGLAKRRQRKLKLFEIFDPLPAMGRTVRILADKEELVELMKRVRRMRKKFTKWGSDRIATSCNQTLVEISAGFARTGDIFKRSYYDDLPALRSIESTIYHALARAEIATDLRFVSAGRYYFTHPSEWFDLADAYFDEKVLTRKKEQTAAKDVKPLWKRQAENSLRFTADIMLNAILQSLPNYYSPLMKLSAASPRWRSHFNQQYEIADAPYDPVLSQVEPLCRLIRIYAQHGRYEDIARIVQATRYRSDLPRVVAEAVKILVDARRADQTKTLIGMLQNEADKAPVNVYLACAVGTKQAKKILQQTLQVSWNAPTINAVVHSFRCLNDRAVRDLTKMLLREGRRRGRQEILIVIAALAPEANHLVGDVEKFATTVDQIFEIESWWQA